MQAFRLAALASAGLLALAACSPPAPSAAPSATPSVAPTETPVADADAYPRAPSAGQPCEDDGERLPLSGVCRGRAINFMDLGATAAEPPQGCTWANNEVWFGGDVMLYRGAVCGDKSVTLEYAGGAHAAELSYTASSLHPEAIPAADSVHPIVRVAEYAENADFRLRETIGSDAAIAQCEIKPAGAGYPEGAKVIAPKTPGADCGQFAVSDTADVFWLVREKWVFTFMLPKGPRDIDPASFTVVTPH